MTNEKLFPNNGKISVDTWYKEKISKRTKKKLSPEEKKRYLALQRSILNPN